MHGPSTSLSRTRFSTETRSTTSHGVLGTAADIWVFIGALLSVGSAPPAHSPPMSSPGVRATQGPRSRRATETPPPGGGAPAGRDDATSRLQLRPTGYWRQGRPG